MPNLSTPNARIPYDMVEYTLFGPNTTRATGTGDSPQSIRMPKACILTGMAYRAGTADASGSTTCQILRNGTAIAGTSLAVAAASQVAGQAINTLWVPIAAGDILQPTITAIGTTPGKGWYVAIHMLIGV